jgi:hypothetical protein
MPRKRAAQADQLDATADQRPLTFDDRLGAVTLILGAKYSGADYDAAIVAIVELGFEVGEDGAPIPLDAEAIAWKPAQTVSRNGQPQRIPPTWNRTKAGEEPQPVRLSSDTRRIVAHLVGQAPMPLTPAIHRSRQRLMALAE